MEKKIRVLIGKVGLDGHDQGGKVISIGLKEEGMEVIYTGLRQSPEAIVEASIQEGVNVIGLSCLSGAHTSLFGQVADLLCEKGIKDILLIGGGIIPEEDIPFLRKKGFKGIFGPGSSIKEVTKFIQNNVNQ